MIILVRNHAHASIYIFIIMFCDYLLFLYSVLLQSGFGFVSGLQTQGYKACSTCGPSLEDMAKYSSHLCKIVYLGHIKFLPLGHDMRSDPLLFSSFDMPYGNERDIPEATTFAYWKDVANRVIDQMILWCLKVVD